MLIHFARRNVFKICILQFIIIWFLMLTIFHMSSEDWPVFSLGLAKSKTPCSTNTEDQETGISRLIFGQRRNQNLLPKDGLYNNSTVYIVTPTYYRLSQRADLTRLSQTLMLVPSMHWIVVEDADYKSDLVGQMLVKSGLNYTHLNEPTPIRFKQKSNEPKWLKARGIHQRNSALDWLRRHRNRLDPSGVVYFADDDNTYDVQLFDEMRSTNRVSVWPVGLVGGLQWEGPKVKNGKVFGWITAWKPEREFPIDMAAFAVKLQLLLDRPAANFNAQSSRGYVETDLLKMLTTPAELEPKAKNCTKILVWHTRTEKYKAHLEIDLQYADLMYASEINKEV